MSKNKDDITLGAQQEDKTQFGRQGKDAEPEFGQGRQTKKHGASTNSFGINSSERTTELLQKSKSAKQTGQQKPRIIKAQKVKKLPPVETTGAFKQLRSAQKTNSIENTSGFGWIIALPFTVLVPLLFAILYASYFMAKVVFFVLQVLVNIALILFKTIMSIIATIIGSTVGGLLSSFLVLGLLAFSAFTFYNSNSELFAGLKQVGSNVVTTTEQATGLSLSNMPLIKLLLTPDAVVDDVKNAAKDITGDIPSFDFTVPNNLADAFNGVSFPAELAPIMSLQQPPEMLNYFKKLLATNQLGSRAEGAVPYLTQSLKSNNLDVSVAANRALQNINTDAAKRVLQDFKNQAERGINGTNFRR